MPASSTPKLRIGAWIADPASGELSRDGQSSRVEIRTMRLLLCLASHAGQVVSIDTLLNEVWSDVIVAPDSVYQAVTSLRRLLGDDPRQPAYIETIPRLGYRMIAKVSPCPDSPLLPSISPAQTDENPARASATPAASRLHLKRILALAAAALCLVLVALYFFRSSSAGHHGSASAATAPPQKSIAVLPFLDLTEGMSNEEFADGMTEELIDKLTKIPGLRVPSPTSSFFFKGKRISVIDIAKVLGVAYILDGSVRKSGTMLRVAARLVRADSGYVIWSETYDRPFHDVVMVQDDIATAVTKALRPSIETNPDRSQN
jgi:transcriptional activator of cad operon